MENSLVTYGFNKDRERLNESNTLRGSVINSAQSSGKKKNIGNVTVKNYLKESLSCILCFIIQGKGSSWKRFDPEI